MSKCIMRYLLGTWLLTAVATFVNAQSVGINTATPHPSAILDVQSNAKGLLVPRLTTLQRNAITSPASGLLVFDTDWKQFIFFADTGWAKIPAGNPSWMVSGNDQYAALGGYVGIGTPSPNGLLHVNQGLLLVTGNENSGDSLTTAGSGTRMFFYPRKAAFRAGHALDSDWDEDKLGYYSVALGNNPYAAGIGSLALGTGARTETSAANALAIGHDAVVMGQDAVSLGNGSVALGNNSFAMGNYVTTIGNNAMALGNNTIAQSFREMALGSFAEYYIPISTANWVLEDRLLVIGNGTGEGSRSNALTLLKNGNLGIGSSNPTQRLEVAGAIKANQIKLTNGAVNGYVLKTDSLGNTSWANPNALGIVENDPKVGLLNNHYIPKWNGSSLANGLLYDNGTNIGIGTTAPTAKLEVSGTVKATQLQMTNGAVNGYVLQGDASGNAAWVNPATLKIDTLSLIADADNNTKIETEKSSNENKIRFTLNGVERMVLQNKSLAIVNTGNSVYIGDQAGQADSIAGPGRANTAVGAKSLQSTTTGVNNVALGNTALNQNTSGFSNNAVGSFALRSNTTGSYNTAMGEDALGSNVVGNANTALGFEAGVFATGSNNVFLGRAAGKNETGSGKLYIANSETATPLIKGDFTTQKIIINDSLESKYLRMSNGAQNGYVLQSNANGDANWVSPASLAITESDPQVASATANTIPKWNGTALVDGVMVDNGTNIGIGTATPATKLDVNGTVKATQVQLTTGATNGYVLQSNAAGLATWVNPTALPITESDPQVTAATLNRIPKWNGSSLADGQILDNGTNIGIGTAAPATKLHVKGHLTVDSGRVSLVNAQRNTFVGEGAGLNNTTGPFNTFIGFNAGKNNVTSSQNVYIGYLAGSENTGSRNVFIGNSAGQIETNVSDRLIIANDFGTPLIAGNFGTGEVSFDQGVGIGTANITQAKLVVSGSKSNSFTSYGYLNRTTPTGTYNGAAVTNDYSIYASNRMAASEFNAFSDAWIKNVKGLTDSQEDLATLQAIEITNYTLKDSIGKGIKAYKKVIAQQVEKVYPQAVSQMTDVVPDIYQQAEAKEDIITLANNLKVGERVKIITEKGEELVQVLAATATRFTINKKLQGKLFVYGREVNDFRTVDYEALATLNISATQALLKKINQTESQNQALQADVEKLKADMEQLKKLLLNKN